MKPLKIGIRYWSATGDYNVYVSPSGYHLFTFKVRDWTPQVVFYPDSPDYKRYSVVKGGLGYDFPLDYFAQLIREKYSALFGVEWQGEIELTKGAQTLLKVKYKIN